MLNKDPILLQLEMQIQQELEKKESIHYCYNMMTHHLVMLVYLPPSNVLLEVRPLLLQPNEVQASS